MIILFKKYWKLLTIFLATLIIYFPSLFVFYTNDDFFLLKIAKADTFSQFINFFNLIKGPDGLGMYRPLTTQVYYSFAWKIFNLNPLGLHVISFLVFFAVIYLVYKLGIDLLNKKKIALVASFLYATSATHFGHLYYLATFQELGMTLFVLLSCLSFIKGKKNITILFFALGLMSKETAVITPLLLMAVYFYRLRRGTKVGSISVLIHTLVPLFIIFGVYLGFRIFSYGFAAGDSYIWDFSFRRLINTLAWYLVWALNLPETLVDFVGPGLRLNPNLFAYWSRQMVPILILFSIQMIGLAVLLVKTILNKDQKIILESNRVSALCVTWFIMSLLPVAFLPVHKFTFYLTLPLLAVVFRIAYLLETAKLGKFLSLTFLSIWAVLSILTVKHTITVSWITQGEKISQKVYSYFMEHKQDNYSQNIVFTDTADDASLPWSPTAIVKTALSDQNFFSVFYPDIAGKVSYGTGTGKQINSRQFLAY